MGVDFYSGLYRRDALKFIEIPEHLNIWKGRDSLIKSTPPGAD